MRAFIQVVQMETKFNFKSQICTTREQSEKLLALGLKKETADMCYKVATHDWRGHEIPEKDKHYSLCSWYDELNIVCGFEQVKTIPAWSLHRLIEMMPISIDVKWTCLSLRMDATKVYYIDYVDGQIRFMSGGGDLYESIIDCIEWLIKEGYFNKEYLV